MKYPSIDTLYKLHPKTGKMQYDQLSHPEFDNVMRWHITEKIDGTNIRVSIQRPIIGEDKLDISYKGRTDNAQLPATLVKYLMETFTKERLAAAFPHILDKNEIVDIILFGEGYGPHIQKGGKYRNDVSFILFDIRIDSFWLEYENVHDIAEKLGIDVVPSYGVRTGFGPFGDLEIPNESLLAAKNGKPEILPEGIVGVSYPMMLFRNGKRVMWKARHDDV